MTDSLSMQLPAEIVERAVRDKINAAIASQLGDPKVLIEKLVARALEEKVDANGKVSSRYNNEFEYLEVLAGDFVRDAAREALAEYFAENKALIKDAVKKEVTKSSGKMAKLFTEALADSIGCNYKTTLAVNFDSRSDY